MKQRFTTEDLIRYIYRETTAAEAIAIGEAIESDPLLLEELEELLEAKRELPDVKFRPSSRSIDRILNYGEATTLEASH
jgi:hypothetical protein